MARKSFEELDLIDDYLMSIVASDPEIGKPFCKVLLSVLLQKNIKDIKVDAQKYVPAIAPNSRGVRLDVEVEEYDDDAIANVYDIEPHTKKESDIPRQLRFRQARIDSRHMKSGDNDFTHLPNLYVIMITNFDLFERDYMMYTFEHKCLELPDIEYDDGLKIIYFNTRGQKGGSKAIHNMLNYIQTSKKSAVTDDATVKIDNFVSSIKRKEELRDGYMTLGQYMDNIIEEEVKIQVAEQVAKKVEEQVADNTLSVKIESIKELLEDYGTIPEALNDRLQAEKDIDVLKKLLKLAARSQSIEEFIHGYDAIES